MSRDTGKIHVYCGDGKGKTTCAMGLCTRAAGFGYRVMIYQFMKDNRTSERKILAELPNITWPEGLPLEKFSFRMTPEEKAERRIYYAEQFKMVTSQAAKGDYDVLFLDEILYTIRADLFEEQLLLDFLDQKPEYLEVILTGRDPSEEVVKRADYVSEIRKVKHPFDQGLPSRKGIEK